MWASPRPASSSLTGCWSAVPAIFLRMRPRRPARSGPTTQMTAGPNPGETRERRRRPGRAAVTKRRRAPDLDGTSQPVVSRGNANSEADAFPISGRRPRTAVAPKLRPKSHRGKNRRARKSQTTAGNGHPVRGPTRRPRVTVEVWAHLSVRRRVGRMRRRCNCRHICCPSTRRRSRAWSTPNPASASPRRNFRSRRSPYRSSWRPRWHSLVAQLRAGYPPSRSRRRRAYPRPKRPPGGRRRLPRRPATSRPRPRLTAPGTPNTCATQGFHRLPSWRHLASPAWCFSPVSVASLVTDRQRRGTRYAPEPPQDLWTELLGNRCFDGPNSA